MAAHKRKQDGDKEDDDAWLFFSPNELTTKQILAGGFNNVILLNAHDWGATEDEPIDEAVADELGYAFGFEQDESLQKLTAETRDSFIKAFIDVFKGWGRDHDFLVVIHGMQDFNADDAEWHMMTLVVNLIEESYSKGCKEDDGDGDDMPGVSIVIEGGSKQLAGEWEDNKSFKYTVQSWQKDKLGWSKGREDNWHKWHGEEWHEEWGDEEWEQGSGKKSSTKSSLKSSPKASPKSSPKSSPKTSEKKEEAVNK